MAQRSSRKRRKQRQREQRERGGATAAPPPAKPDSDSDRMARGYARGRAKDEAARAALVPLAAGERPRAVTVAGLLAAFIGLANLIAFLAGMEVRGEQPNLVGVGLFTFIMLTAAYGCFRVRYWAVLGMQALLGADDRHLLPAAHPRGEPACCSDRRGRDRRRRHAVLVPREIDGADPDAGAPRRLSQLLGG